MVCASPEEKERVLSQVKRVIRPLYSSPPLQSVSLDQTIWNTLIVALYSGAQLVAIILGTPELYEQWCALYRS